MSNDDQHTGPTTTIIIKRDVGNAAGIASLVFGIIGIFFLSPVFVPLALIFGIVAIAKKQLAFGISGVVCALLGFITSPILMGIFGLLTLSSLIDAPTPSQPESIRTDLPSTSPQQRKPESDTLQPSTKRYPSDAQSRHTPPLSETFRKNAEQRRAEGAPSSPSPVRPRQLVCENPIHLKPDQWAAFTKTASSWEWEGEGACVIVVSDVSGRRLRVCGAKNPEITINRWLWLSSDRTTTVCTKGLRFAGYTIRSADDR